MTFDLTSPIDLRKPADAEEWARTAMAKRPVRRTFFTCFRDQLRALDVARPRVLELGSGPGLLAEYLLRALPNLEYVMLDFSSAMHAIAARRLGGRKPAVRQVERSFAEPGFSAGLGAFDAVVTLQAVHELGHKRQARALHAEVRDLLAPAGTYLLCDHFVGHGGMKNDERYMTREEQRDALLRAGFSGVREVLCKSGLVLHRAVP